MKNLIYLIIALVVGCWFALNYVAQRTVDTTTQLIADEIHTDWVKCAKECESDTITIADSINTELGDELR